MYLSHLSTLHGLPVREFPGIDSTEQLPAADSVAWLIRGAQGWDEAEPWDDRWDRFLETVDLSAVHALVVGPWEYDRTSAFAVELIAEAADELTSLEAVFLGDIVAEEYEISWIPQGDVTPLLAAYPGLRELGVRGAGLRFGPLHHPSLRRLRVESGGLPAEAVRGIAASDLPALEHLELWLGVDDYGGDATVDDLTPLLTGERLPALRSLGLCNSDIQDQIATAVASAPVVAQLSELALSMGTLGDAGAEALLTGQPLTHLSGLDLGHHFLSEEMQERLRSALEPHGVRVTLNGGRGRTERYGRYPAVTE